MGLIEPRYPEGLPIAGAWTTDGVDVVDIIFPFDGATVASAPVGTTAHAAAAVEAGLAVQPRIAALSAAVRRRLLLAVGTRIEELRSEFEQLLVAETGKPLVDCRTEVDRTLFTWSAAAEAITSLHGETVPLDIQPGGEGMIGYWTRKPIGLVVGIAGFNYPLLLATHKIAPSIAAGCAVICKPAPNTPLATLWLTHLIHQVADELSVPRDIVQLVTGGPEVGRTLTADPRIGAVSFTGSASVGHQIARDCAPRKFLLELGSNAALVVASDADLEAAADAVIRGGFYGNGQACISIQRIIADQAIVEDLAGHISNRMAEVVFGDPRLPETRVGALIDEKSTQRVLDWVEEALSAGAKLLSGGRVHGRVLEPTVLLDVPADVRVWDEEIFGPVVCIRTVPNLDAAISTVNASRYGLQASVYTSSLSTAFRAIDELDVGGVVVNQVPGYRNDIMPYGGVKDSGIGREGPRFAMEELTVTRMAVIRPS
ncbi:aldehyde dehydrogenase family protein [Rhodococcus sp. UNC23MFCrub1.1]|uniref:aldehyde dehydrogenase family protein n=1 Tax=Rhodococcus sp. UNC23MFCrub1.1 TaxID=1449068 RepID=UPI0005663F09|nr:aldehyde dehydrogenase family protein [Rhodococcus sp. UNC23MFCrub1.1]